MEAKSLDQFMGLTSRDSSLAKVVGEVQSLLVELREKVATLLRKVSQADGISDCEDP